MGKAPAFQFYVKDWLSDPQLRMASLSTRGIWIDLLCFMWEAPKRGEIEISDSALAKLTGSNNGEVELFLKESQEFSFCDIFVTCHGESQKCHIINRRMKREHKVKDNAKLRKRRQREREACHAEITPPSSSSSSTSSTNIYVKSFFLKDGTKYLPPPDYLAELLSSYPDVDLPSEFLRIRAWCLSNVDKRKTKVGAKRFINSWMARAQQNAEKNKPPKPKIMTDEEIEAANA